MEQNIDDGNKSLWLKNAGKHLFPDCKTGEDSEVKYKNAKIDCYKLNMSKKFPTIILQHQFLVKKMVRVKVL